MENVQFSNDADEIASNKRVRLDITARHDLLKEHTLSCIVMKLNSACPHQVFREGVTKVCLILSQLTLEVYQVLNFHYLRVCNDPSLTVADLSETLIRHACRLLLQLDPEYPVGVTPLKNVDPQLRLSVELYAGSRRQTCPTHLLFQLGRHMSGLNHVVTELCKTIYTNCRNDLVNNTYSRIQHWIKHTLFLNGKDAARFFAEAFDESLDDSSDFEHQLHLKFKDWLEFYPNAYNIKRHSAHFLKVLHRILAALETPLEARVDCSSSSSSSPGDEKLSANDSKDGVETHSKGFKKFKKFTLLPLKSGFTVDHLQLSNSSLQQVIAWIEKDKRREVGFRDFTFASIYPSTLVPPPYDSSQNAKVVFFMQHKEEIWRALFRVFQHETCKGEADRGRKFNYHISTNGYSCSISYMQRNKCLAQAPNEDSEDSDGPFPNDSTVASTPEFIPSRTVLNRVIGIDPGHTDLGTIAGYDMIEGKKCSKELFGSISTAEYRHQAHMDQQRFWFENVKTRFLKYKSQLEHMNACSLRTSSSITLSKT